MLQIVALSQIKSRAEAIGLSLKTIAKQAGLDASNLYRGAGGASDYHTSTAAKALAVLVEREKQTLAHLARLYPDLAIRAAKGEAAPADTRQLDLEDLTGRAAS